jgi:hypothetical protein
MLVHKDMFEVQEHLISVYLFQQHSLCPHYTVAGHTVQDQCDVGLGVGTDGVFLHWASKLRCHQNCGPPSSCSRTAVPPATERRRSVSKVMVLDLKIHVFRDVMLCHWMESPWCFEEQDCLQNVVNCLPNNRKCLCLSFPFRVLQALS